MSAPAPWVVVPAYQAEATLGAVLERVPPWLGERRGRVLVVDDGSRDRTAEIARAHGADVVVQAENLGYARAQKRGIRAALDGGAGAVAILHADGQYPP